MCDVTNLVVVDVVVAVVVVGVGDHEGCDVEDAQQEGDQLYTINTFYQCHKSD
jgi:hypothetical protein